jgi:hypothetical protein
MIEYSTNKTMTDKGLTEAVIETMGKALGFEIKVKPAGHEEYKLGESK